MKLLLDRHENNLQFFNFAFLQKKIDTYSFYDTFFVAHNGVYYSEEKIYIEH